MRSVIENIDLWLELGKSAEQTHRSLYNDLKSLKEAYIERKRNRVKREIGSSLLNTMLGTTVAKTLPGARKTYKSWKEKVNGLDVRGTKVGRAIPGLLSDVAKLEKLLNKAQGKEATAILKKVKKLRGKLDDVLKATSKLNGRVREAREAETKIAKLFKTLEKDRDWSVKGAEIIGQLIPLAFSVVETGVGAGFGFAGAAKTPELAVKILDFTNTGLSLAQDIESIVADEVVARV
ncbi:MAG: hypothetical protein QF473_20740 [Planctomycetota bacterium]|nr:hypothetical protein [Planctomycetota bacterium]